MNSTMQGAHISPQRELLYIFVILLVIFTIGLLIASPYPIRVNPEEL